MGAYDDELKKYDTEWENYEGNIPGAVPDGRYIAKVKEAYLKRSESSGNLMLKWVLEIIGGEYAHTKVYRQNMMQTPDNMKWLKIDLKCAGVELKKASELEAALPRLLDIFLEIKKVTKGEFENIYFVRQIPADKVPGVEGEQIPF
jgi:hypothetical protein